METHLTFAKKAKSFTMDLYLHVSSNLMEEYIIPEDIHVICIVASSFPEGVKAAHKKLHSLIPFSNQRRYFGISWGQENGIIHYQAAADVMNEDELNIPGTKQFVIRKGNYMSVVLHDYMEEIAGIGKAFTELLSLPNIDPNGYCLEWYISDREVRCMVPLDQERM